MFVHIEAPHRLQFFYFIKTWYPLSMIIKRRFFFVCPQLPNEVLESRPLFSTRELPSRAERPARRDPSLCCVSRDLFFFIVVHGTVGVDPFLPFCQPGDVPAISFSPLDVFGHFFSHLATGGAPLLSFFRWTSTSGPFFSFSKPWQLSLPYW